MAKKRLNKRLVAILSVIVLGLALLGMVVVFRYRFQDPLPYLEEARLLTAKSLEERAQVQEQVAQQSDPEQAYATWKKGREERIDPLVEQAGKAFGSAVRFARRNVRLKLDVLREMADMFLAHERYDAANGAWGMMVRLDSKNVSARRRLLNFLYEQAKAVSPQVWLQAWQPVERDAQRLIEATPEEAWGYALVAHAKLRLLRAGVTQDAAASLQEIGGLLAQVFEREPNSVLGSAIRGELLWVQADQASSAEEKQAYRGQVEAELRAALAAHPEDPQAYLNLYELFWRPELVRQYQEAAGETDAAKKQSLRAQADEAVAATSRELAGWQERFGQDGRFAAARAEAEQLAVRRAAQLGPIAALYEQALASPNRDVAWYPSLVNVYQLQGEATAAGRPLWEKAYATLRRGLYLPEVQESSGPQQSLRTSVRFLLLQQGVDLCYLLSSESEGEARQGYVAQAEQAARQLTEAIGAERAESKLARGTAALARGNQAEAWRLLDEALRMLQEMRRPQGATKRRLFEALRGTRYHGLGVRYGIEAILEGSGTARLSIEVLEAAVQSPYLKATEVLLGIADEFASQWAVDDTYADRLARARGALLVQAGRRAEAREALAAVSVQDVAGQIWWARAQESEAERAAVLEQVVREQPAQPDALRLLYGYYMARGTEEATNYDKARSLLAAAVQADPQNVDFLQTQRLLNEPDPAAVSQERREQILLEVLEGLPAGAERELQLGDYYRARGDQAAAPGSAAGGEPSSGAAAEWQKAREHYAAAEAAGGKQGRTGVWETSLLLKDWGRAEAVLGQVGREDGRERLLLEGQLKTAQEQWSDAASRLESYLREQPISVPARLLLARAYEALRRPDAALREAREAARQGMTELAAQRYLLGLLHNRNQGKGLNQLTDQELIETIITLEGVLGLRRDDEYASRLLVVYYPLFVAGQLPRLGERAGLSTEQRQAAFARLQQGQDMAVATCRRLVDQEPQNVIYWRTLAGIMYQYALVVPDAAERERLLGETEKVYQEAMKANPQAMVLSAAYAQFQADTGQGRQAEQRLVAATEQSSGAAQQQARLTLGSFYARQGRYDEAAGQLEAVLAEEEGNTTALQGLAEVRAQQGRPEEALRLYDRLLAKQADPVVARRRAELLIWAGQYDAAEQALAELERQSPQELIDLLLRSQLEQRRTNYAKAVAYADQALAKAPGHTTAYLLKGEALFYAGKYNEALACLQELRARVGPDSNVGRVALAQVYWALNRQDETIAEMEAALRTEPRSDTIRRNLMRLLQRARRWDRLEQLYAEVLQQQPDSVALRVEAAEAAVLRGDDEAQQGRARLARVQYEKALGELQAALQQAGDKTAEARAAGLALARLRLQLGQYNEVVALTDRFLAANAQDVRMLVSKAGAWYGLGRKVEALAAYGRALEMSGKDAQQSTMVLNEVRDRLKPADTIPWCEQQLAARPDWVQVRLLLAQAYGRQEDYVRQVEELQAARAKADESSQDFIDNLLATAHVRMNQPEEAIVCYRRLAERQGENTEVLNNLAYLLLGRTGSEDEAVQLAEKASRLAPTNTNIMDTYALALIAKGRFGEAETVARRTIQEQQRLGEDVPAESYYRLGAALQGQGRADEARETWRTALQQMARIGTASGVGQDELRGKIEAALQALEAPGAQPSQGNKQ